MSDLAARSGHNVSPGEIDQEFNEGEHEAEEFEKDVDMDPQAKEWEEEGEHEAESDWEEWEQNKCPCDEGHYCNNDYGKGPDNELHGFCEPCGRH